MSLDFHPIIEKLKAGGVILHRPDSIWGLSCDATHKAAVQKIDRLKNRSSDKSYIVLVNNEAMLERHVQSVPEVAYDLIEASVDPLTIIYPQGLGLAPGVCAADGSVAIRIVKDKITHDIIYKLSRPLISTSANISGELSPASLHDVSSSIKDDVEYIVQRDDAPMATKASTIIKLALNGEFSIIRP